MTVGLEHLYEGLEEPDQAFIFLQRDLGKQFESSSFNNYFKHVLLPKLHKQGERRQAAARPMQPARSSGLCKGCDHFAQRLQSVVGSWTTL